MHDLFVAAIKTSFIKFKLAATCAQFLALRESSTLILYICEVYAMRNTHPAIHDSAE